MTPSNIIRTLYKKYLQAILFTSLICCNIWYSMSCLLEISGNHLSQFVIDPINPKFLSLLTDSDLDSDSEDFNIESEVPGIQSDHTELAAHEIKLSLLADSVLYSGKTNLVFCNNYVICLQNTFTWVVFHKTCILLF